MLTVRQIEAAKARDKPYKLADGQGLYLFVATTGTKSWRANFKVAGKQKTRTYGLWPALALAEARKQHQAARGAAEAPPEPQGAPAPTFREVAESWMKKHLPGLSNPKHRAQVRATLEQYAYPALGDRRLDTIERAQLTTLVKDIIAKPGRGGDSKVETAYRVAGRITAVFDYAVDDGTMKSHQAFGLARVLPTRRTKDPMASIAPEEAGQLLLEILDYPEPVTRLGLLLAAHTFVRTNELRGFREDELREEGAVWVVPADRVKGEAGEKLPHVVPMSRQARGYVRQLAEMGATGLLLESPDRPGQPISENTMLFALYRMGYKHRMTVHGFRALASTVLNEQSPFDKDVIERQLAHKEVDDVRAAYNRAEYLPQRRQLMQWWSDWLDAQVAKAINSRDERGTRAAG